MQSILLSKQWQLGGMAQLTILDWVLVVTGFIYLVAIAWLHSGLWRVWRNRRSPLLPASANSASVTVLVAARDEEVSLPACLQALQSQRYDGTLEIIVVDDRSCDDTPNIVRRFADDWPALRLVEVVEQRLRCPKKNALAHGIEVSSGELLLFTDADCQPEPQWVRSMVRAFDDGVGMVAGYAAVQTGQRWIHSLLALDNLAVSAMGAGSMGMGAPLSCSGRNLAFRRRVYDEVGGYSSVGHLMGGDDVYMMRLIGQRTSWSITYNADPESAVASSASSGRPIDIIHQKLRHASKAAHYGGAARLLGVCIYTFHLSLVAGLYMVAAGTATGGGTVIFGVWSLRWVADGSLLWHFASRFTRHGSRLLRLVPALEVSYLPYILLGVPLGGLGLFRWKGSTAPLTRGQSFEKERVME